MGRYYTGDINGKFWFAVQSSDDANFFGVHGEQNGNLEYCYDEEHLPQVRGSVQKCKDTLGEDKDKLDNFFKGKDGYNEEMIMSALCWSKHRVVSQLVWYARLKLGEKILKCLLEKGECCFEAELG